MKTFERYCKDYENIENYEKAKADNFKGWCCHHRKGVYIQTEELQSLGMYYNRPAEELIFLTRSEHQILHRKGHKHSESTKRKMSETWDYDKHFTAETRNKISEARKGKCTGEDNPFYGKHHSDEVRNKISEAKKGNTYTKGKRWYNNGKINIMAKECPPGFVPGKLRK